MSKQKEMAKIAYNALDEKKGEDIKVIDGGRRVMLSDYEGHALVVNLENYISNEIMNYCFKGWC